MRDAPHRLPALIRAQDALEDGVEVEVRVDAEGEAVLDGVDVPDVHRVVDGLDAVAGCLSAEPVRFGTWPRAGRHVDWRGAQAARAVTDFAV